MIKRVPTTQEIQSIYESGDYDSLRALNETLAKRANQRMSALEAQGLGETAAARRAKYYNTQVSDIAKGDRFSRSKNIDMDSLYEQVKQESIFLRSQTSTVSGEKKRREKIIDSLEEGGVISLPDSPKEADKFKDQFLEFLDDDVWKDIKKYNYYTEILSDASEAIQHGAKIEELQAAFESFRAGELDIISIWDNWINVK